MDLSRSVNRSINMTVEPWNEFFYLLYVPYSTVNPVPIEWFAGKEVWNKDISLVDISSRNYIEHCHKHDITLDDIS